MRFFVASLTFPLLVVVALACGADHGSGGAGGSGDSSIGSGPCKGGLYPPSHGCCAEFPCCGFDATIATGCGYPFTTSTAGSTASSTKTSASNSVSASTSPSSEASGTAVSGSSASTGN